MKIKCEIEFDINDNTKKLQYSAKFSNVTHPNQNIDYNVLKAYLPKILEDVASQSDYLGLFGLQKIDKFLE